MQFSTIHNSLDSQLEFEVNYCGTITHDNLWSEERTKPTYAIWIVNKGNVCIEYSNRIHKLNEGDAFFFKRESYYKAWTESQEGCGFIFILFDVYIGRSLCSTDILQTEGFLESVKVKNETDAICNCLKNYADELPLSLLHLKYASIYLIIKMITELRTSLLNAQNNEQEKLDNLKTVLIYIDENIHREINIKELADTLHMSEKYFITYFKKTIGVTPFSYITSIKMKKAYEYIGAKGYSVKQASEIIGYSDPYVFSKAFKRVYGFAPSRIRETDKAPVN